MSQRSTAPLKGSTIHRTLHWFWWVTRKKPFATFMAVFTSVTYTALLNYANTWVMGLIVDRVSAQPVPAAQVWEVFAPYVIAFWWSTPWARPARSCRTGASCSWR